MALLGEHWGRNRRREADLGERCEAKGAEIDQESSTLKADIEVFHGHRLYHCIIQFPQTRQPD